MSYLDSGYNKFFYRNMPRTIEKSEDLSSYEIPLLVGGSIAGGITKSRNGKVLIDWDKGRILVGDGAHWRVLIGEDGL